MRRLTAVLTFVGFTLGLVALPATALGQTASPTTSTAHGSLNDEVSGPFTGTSTFDVPTGSGVHQVFDGTYTSAKNGQTGSFHLEGFNPLISLAPWSGTFTLTASDGATMNGTVAGTFNVASLPNVAISFTLTPTGGTGKFKNVGGVVNLTGTWVTSEVPGVPGPFSGSLAGALTH